MVLPNYTRLLYNRMFPKSSSINRTSHTIDVVHREPIGEVGQVGLLPERSILDLLWLAIIQTLHMLMCLCLCVCQTETERVGGQILNCVGGISIQKSVSELTPTGA